MADHDQLERLTQDVEGWNAWRSASPKIQIDLKGATLSGAYLSFADLSGANLSNADLRRVDLSGANLSNADLNKTQLTYATTSQTTFGNVDLRTVKGLETVEHQGPSTIGIDTIYRSHGNIPESFLRGA